MRLNLVASQAMTEMLWVTGPNWFIGPPHASHEAWKVSIGQTTSFTCRILNAWSSEAHLFVPCSEDGFPILRLAPTTTDRKYMHSAMSDNIWRYWTKPRCPQDRSYLNLVQGRREICNKTIDSWAQDKLGTGALIDIISRWGKLMKIIAMLKTMYRRTNSTLA